MVAQASLKQRGVELAFALTVLGTVVLVVALMAWWPTDSRDRAARVVLSWATPKTGAIYDKETGLPLRVIHRVTQIELVLVKGGEFMMGADLDDPQDPLAYWWEGPRHRRRVNTFYIGKCEVTQAQWKAVMGYNPSSLKGWHGPGYKTPQPGLPVHGVSWDDACAFAIKTGFRLPTETEWEYACRAGTTGPAYGNYDDVAWHRGNSDGTVHLCGTKAANRLGLFDTLGNVYEWCREVEWPVTERELPFHSEGAPLAEGYQVLRGGAWSAAVDECRAAYRFWQEAHARNGHAGFRVARDP